MELTTVLFTPEGEVLQGDKSLIETWKQNPKSTLWLDIQFSDIEKTRAILNEYSVHPLAIDDAMRARHPPKIEFFDEQLFIVYRGIESNSSLLEFKHQQIALFVENNLLISVHPAPSYGINKTKEAINKLKSHSPLGITLTILRNASQLYLDNLLDFDGHLSDLEDKLQARGDDNLLSELTAHRSRLIKLIRTFKYHCSITQALSNETEEFEHLNPEALTHAINDLHDRFDRLTTLAQMHYDIGGDLIDGYLSISAHQLNVTMRVLTVITAVFVPLSFLAGLYGMNFEYIPELKVESGYFILLGTMALVATGLLYTFKRKRWL
jgi:magnesium transporter